MNDCNCRMKVDSLSKLPKSNIKMVIEHAISNVSKLYVDSMRPYMLRSQSEAFMGHGNWDIVKAKEFDGLGDILYS